MSEPTLWERVSEWLAYFPIVIAYRIIWLAAWLNLGSARAIYRAMWDANLSLPPLKPRGAA